MKLKTLAKRLRTRSDELQRVSLQLENGDSVAADRARLHAEILLEVADQISPPTKKKLKKREELDRKRRIVLAKVDGTS